MRLSLLVSVLALAAFLAACGDAPKPPRSEPEVKLRLTGPADAAVVRAETVQIRGTVAPAGAEVQVLGRKVAVDGGSFSTDVSLKPGANLIDVAASARGRRPDFAVTRVVFEQRVPLPDVIGSDADTAQDQLEGLGLTVKRQDAGGFFDPILPGSPKVCEMQPAAGEQVLPGTEVTVLVARSC
jgi:hypothetical protein